MPHLVETYARTTGLRIAKMLVTPHFYPLGIDDPYVLVVTGSGAAGKNYSHWRIVMDRLRPALAAKGYKIVQTGGKDDERIGADVDLCGKTTNPQYFSVVERAELVLSGDTSALHLAGHFNKKSVSLFSVSHPTISGAWFGDKKQQAYLTPENWRPSFNPQEIPKMIDKIRPEVVIKAVSELLDLEYENFETVFIGGDVNLHLLETIPNSVVRPDFFPGNQMNIRYDKGGTEEMLYEQLKVRKAVIITDKVLNLQTLHMLRPNIDGIIYIVTEKDEPKFLEGIHRNAFPYRLVCMLPDEIARDKKLSYVDYHLLERKDRASKENTKLVGEITERTRFKSNKRILSEGKIYLSFAHLAQQKPLDNLTQGEDNVIDTPEFWEDVNFYHILNK